MVNPPMKRTVTPFSLVALCCCLALSATACGQRGPLYLPEPETPVGETLPENQEESDSGVNSEESDDGGGRES